MIENMLSQINFLLIMAIPMILAITVHEAAHAYAAKLCGDNTAEQMGRLTLNPIKHIDPVGTILIPSICLLLGGFFFGWAKPVPFNPNRLRYPIKDVFWVAVAGPLSNFGMAIVAMVAMRLIPSEYTVLQTVMMEGVKINLILMIFNLLPIPPLDGSKMLSRFLNAEWRWKLNSMERYGIFIVLGLSLVGVLGPFWIFPLYNVFFNALSKIIFI